MKAILHTDGGARGNPGPAGIGIVLTDESGDVIAEVGEGIGVTTNNVAEYTALTTGLRMALDLGVSEIDVRVDSQLVVSQVKGEWKIKQDHLRPLAVEARSLLDRFERASIEHVPRESNADADKLANQGMDAAMLDADLDAEMPDQGSLLE
ncbi:MAG: ribonuclease HI family protein [Actinomycetota bacterium]